MPRRRPSCDLGVLDLRLHVAWRGVAWRTSRLAGTSRWTTVCAAWTCWCSTCSGCSSSPAPWPRARAGTPTCASSHSTTRPRAPSATCMLPAPTAPSPSPRHLERAAWLAAHTPAAGRGGCPAQRPPPAASLAACWMRCAGYSTMLKMLGCWRWCCAGTWTCTRVPASMITSPSAALACRRFAVGVGVGGMRRETPAHRASSTNPDTGAGLRSTTFRTACSRVCLHARGPLPGRYSCSTAAGYEARFVWAAPRSPRARRTSRLRPPQVLRALRRAAHQHHGRRGAGVQLQRQPGWRGGRRAAAAHTRRGGDAVPRVPPRVSRIQGRGRTSPEANTNAHAVVW